MQSEKWFVDIKSITDTLTGWAHWLWRCPLKRYFGNVCNLSLAMVLIVFSYYY